MSTSTRDSRSSNTQLSPKQPRPPAAADARATSGSRAWLRVRRCRPLALVVMLLVTIAAAGLAYLPYTLTPDVRPASAPDGVFSAERAMIQLEAVASEPRPMGSAEHEETVATLQERLGELGVESQVVDGVVTRNDFNQVFVGRLRNVIARIPGTDSTGTVALLSHFDSLPSSMNANDGGLGVAALLETVRAIEAGPPLANDVVLWFGDADETTALNALLLQEHPWFRDVRFGFAFEAPGVTGPSVLTFAGQGDPGVEPPLMSLGEEEEALSLDGSALVSDDGRWLREALEAVPDVTVALPLNDLGLGASPDLGMSMWGTDVAGVSFSQIGDSSGYHTILDRPDRVAPASLQQAGDISLALARHFGDLDLTAVPESGGLVAFTVAPGQTVTYPAGLALPAGALVLLAAVGLVVIGKRRGRLTITGLLLGIVTTVVAVAAAAMAAVLITNPMAPEVHYARNPSGAGWRMLVLSAVTLTVVAGLFLGSVRLLRREHRVTGLLLGPVTVVAALSVLTGAGMPALSYVFVWPALGGVLVAAWEVFGSERPANPWPQAALLAASGAMVAVVGVPLVHLLASAASIAAPMFAVVIAIVVALLGSLLVPQLRALANRRLWAAPTVLAAVAVAGLVGVQLSSGFNTERPRPDYIQYTLDADTGQATWLSTGTSPDKWTEQFIPDGYSTDRRAFSPGYFFGQEFDVIEAAASAVSLPAPELTVLGDTTTDGVRTLRLRLTSPRGATTAHLDLDLPGDLVAATVGGQTVKVDPGGQQRKFSVAAYNLGAHGIQITLSVRGTDLITGTLTDYSNGLPDLPGGGMTERPPQFMPAPFDFRDPTAVIRSIEL